MPIYEFECAACGHRFERLQKIADADPTECPQCAKAQVSRRVSAPSFRLAGSGWYETDFKSDKDNKRNLVDKAEGKPAESAAASSEKPASPAPAAESKPAATPASSGGASS